jgi:hypothetical protein
MFNQFGYSTDIHIAIEAMTGNTQIYKNVAPVGTYYSNAGFDTVLTYWNGTSVIL